MSLITHADLRRFAPHAAPAIVDAIVDHADDVLARRGLATAPRIVMLMAMMSAETGGLRRLDEDLNYSAEGLRRTWPHRFPSLAAAAPLAHKPEAIADAVYGGRMGNTGPNDGWLNRGQGLIQTTGHDNIARLARELGVTFDACRARLTDPAHMLDCAAATFVMLGCLPFADRGDVLGCTRRLNGGTNGLAERRTAFAVARRVWPRLPSPFAPPAKPHPVPPVPVPAPADPPPANRKATPVKTGFLAFLLSLFGVSLAHAGVIDGTQAAVAGVDNIVAPVLAICIPIVSGYLSPEIKRFLGQKAATAFQVQFNQEAKVALAWAARQADAWITKEDFHINVDSWIVSMAADYMNSHAAKVTKKAGGVLAEKLEARLSSHEDVLDLKARAANLREGSATQPAPLAKAA